LDQTSRVPVIPAKAGMTAWTLDEHRAIK